MAARGGFQTAPTGGGGGAMGPGPPVPGAGPGMGPGTPSGRMGPSSAAQNHMYRSPMPGPGYPVRYRSIFAAVALASPLEQSLTAALSLVANINHHYRCGPQFLLARYCNKKSSYPLETFERNTSRDYRSLFVV